MSYNSLVKTTVIHSSDSPTIFDPSISGHTTSTSPLQQAHKKRRPSKGKIQTDIRRSSSTPHMRNLALQNSGELSPTTQDKRRNKLGYHRTSVACGHCRRRKIRCLIAPDDIQGRCANCIRLKKECNFYPVEQNPDSQRPLTGANKDVSIGAPESSTTSSPRHPPSIAGDKDEFRPPFPGQVTTPTSRYAPPPDAEIDPASLSHSGGIHPHHPPYAYPPPLETQWHTPGFLPSSSMAETSPSSSGFWQPSPSTANSTYGSDSNVSGGRTPATVSTTSNISYGGHPENWPHPNMQPPQTQARSMSYPNIDGLPHQSFNAGLGIQHDYPRRNSPYSSYPSAIDTNQSSSQGSTLGSNAPLSAPILPNQQFNYPPPSPWNPYGGMQNPGSDMPMHPRTMSAQWYGETGPLDQVQEEGGPPGPYGHTALPPHGMPHYYSGA